MRIEDYALIGDTQTAALVGRDGSIDWLCLPRFDSGACFASLLGEARHGRWLLSPGSGLVVRRAAATGRGRSILETEFETDGGAVRAHRFHAAPGSSPDVVRIVEGAAGPGAPPDGAGDPIRLRLDQSRGSAPSTVCSARSGGPDSLYLRTPVETRRRASHDGGRVRRLGRRARAVRADLASLARPPTAPADAERALAETEAWWKDWSGRCTYTGPWREQVLRSLITLKALTYAPTGGIVAAPTTSLPEALGGVRNWDYRYCWLRDATFTLYSLMAAGYRDEARAWRDWLLRAVAGDPAQLQIMYGPAGERRLTEIGARLAARATRARRPVRIGNAAVRPAPAGRLRRGDGHAAPGAARRHRRRRVRRGICSRSLLDFLETGWNQPDEGIWEVRGPRRHFTHSKVMAWVAVDRAVQGHRGLRPARRRGALEAPAGDHPRGGLREGLRRRAASFVQYYGGRELDASLLMIPLVGFLPPGDQRVRATVEAIERELCHDGFVLRYQTGASRPRRRPAPRRGRLSRLHLLAGGQLLAARPPRRGAAAVRAAPRRVQRRGPAVRAVRSARAPPPGQLSPGLLARLAHQYRVQSLGRCRAGRAPDERRRVRCAARARRGRRVTVGSAGRAQPPDPFGRRRATTGRWSEATRASRLR